MFAEPIGPTVPPSSFAIEWNKGETSMVEIELYLTELFGGGLDRSLNRLINRLIQVCQQLLRVSDPGLVQGFFHLLLETLPGVGSGNSDLLHRRLGFFVAQSGFPGIKGLLQDGG